MDTIDLYMWGFQQHYQVIAEGTAKRVFKSLNSRLHPSVFLVGVLEDQLSERHPVCLEPESPGINVTAFKNIHSVAATLRSVDPESRMFQSHPVAQEHQDRRLDIKSYRNAILEILNRENAYSDDKYFISYPAKIYGYLVFVLLKFNKSGLDETYSLTKTKFNDRFEISSSFTDSLIKVFLNSCKEALYNPTPGPDGLNRNEDEMYRLAGNEFMYTISQAGGNFDGLHGLYDACNTISSLRYEGSEGIGKVVIAKRGHKNIKMILELADPIDVSNYRKVRKFLEVADKNSVVFSDSAFIYGLAEITGKYNPSEESLFEIEFLQHYKWEVKHDGNAMMTVAYMQPNIPKDKIDKRKFELDIVRIFNKIEKRDIEYLWDLINQATQQLHGTMLVITDNAKNEASRLGKQSFALNPIKLNKEYFKTITSIDGAVLLDRKGICHAIGVILDGKATKNGDASRGARYNSAIRYLEGVRKPTLIVIISEDGMINLIPDLIPQIRHSTITSSIEKFRSFSTAGLNRKEYYKFMDFFRNARFYLTQVECDEIEEIRKIIDEKSDLKAGINIHYDVFSPNPLMNNSYYLNE